MRLPRFSALALLLVCGLLAASGCASSRIERYFTSENAPAVDASKDGVRLQLLYFKQSMRHFYAIVRITNNGSTPLVFSRQGDDQGQALLLAEGKSYPAEAPSHASWTPWTGTVEQNREQLAKLEIAPGTNSEVSLRWEFPTNTSTYRFDWQLVFHGLRRGEQTVPDITVGNPGEE